MNRHHISLLPAPLMIVLLAACGPVHTTGSGDTPQSRRALLQVQPAVRGPAYGDAVIERITIDGQVFNLADAKPIDFWLTPAEHRVTASLIARRENVTLADEITLTFTAGAGEHYQLSASGQSAGVDGFISNADAPSGPIARGGAGMKPQPRP